MRTRCSTAPIGPSSRRQIEYGRQRGVPWGISESGYNTIDQHPNYQYRAFGVPGLGLKRGLAEDLVIAPYATALALMVAPEAACRNLERLAADGQQGAMDSTKRSTTRRRGCRRGPISVTVRQFMAHHEGMSLLSLAYVLLDKPMQRRFLADPMLRAADLLLQERVPNATAPIFPHASEASATRHGVRPKKPAACVYLPIPTAPTPEVHLLSNGRYHVAVTSAGGGYSRWRDLAVTRWREDATRDCWGSFCYVRDVDSGAVWSTAWQPTTQAREELRGDLHASAGRVPPHATTRSRRIRKSAFRPKTTSSCGASRSPTGRETPRTIEVTSYAEVVLATQAAGRGASGVQQSVRADRARPQPAGDLLHAPSAVGRGTAALDDPHDDGAGGTTRRAVVRDRSPAVHRPRRTLAVPAALDDAPPLSNSAGPVLDPIVSIRQTVLLQPNETVRIDIVTGVAETRDAASSADREVSAIRAWPIVSSTWPGRTARSCCSSSCHRGRRAVYGRLAGSIIYANPRCGGPRPACSPQSAGAIGPVGLWHFRRPADRAGADSRPGQHRTGAPARAGPCLLATERAGGRPGDLERGRFGYRQTLQDAIMDLVARQSGSVSWSTGRAAFSFAAASKCRTKTARCCRRWRA